MILPVLDDITAEYGGNVEAAFIAHSVWATMQKLSFLFGVLTVDMFFSNIDLLVKLFKGRPLVQQKLENLLQ